MVTSIHRPTKAIIDLSAITQNIENILQQLSQEMNLFAVVKADGYGHGAVAVANAALKAGANGFCVATIDEGIELREAGITQPILVLGVVETSYIHLLSEYDLAFPVTTLAWLKDAAMILQLEQLPRPLKVHLKVDTGMGRIGFLASENVNEAVRLIESIPQIEWEGIFTHFATADQAEKSYYETQKNRFMAILEQLPYQPLYVHDSNSATALWHEPIGNLVRYGVALYGLNPSGQAVAAPYKLKAALELVSAVVQVKQLPKGYGIGYGETYITPKPEWIGTVPIGYADGWLRKLQGFHILVDGNFCEIVGRVCMDQIMIRLPHEVPVGTKVTLIGKNGGHEITLQQVAEKLETIHYEVACGISPRVPREYIE
ncbi:MULTISPECIES: alanine racemase [Enterococcus]|uniref:alanine racemase n=1 Tax=Enterococcus TaxID=1350 RepID=UPI0021D44CDD|nr:alanine racemase [Enterococcus dispar]MCU7356933.1 alanine racemase [Enterococcus dispar]MDT2705035.1 alanine racemase [Enterococcus dispar]WCG32501.1 alanine racemase [Enterococcus dispar]